ncbi:pentapeptide repeat-containing protein [Catellatospora chokoriensis]|uniref:pentapeptide repeat-containing protein n=1 Tax=Catellatospora chokoriensis TaxID=310353 RepID=UPI001942C586|nr:pentapeptide repeat-containing protein [Catellatospora chokoriensis]
MGGVAVFGIAALSLWMGLNRPDLANVQTWEAKDSLDLVRIALVVTGGLGGVVALVVAYRKQRVAEDANRREEEASRRDEAKLYNERFIAASQLIGHDSAMVRMTGIQAMAGLADDWLAGRQTCINVLCSYLRMPYDHIPGDHDLVRGEREVRLIIIGIISEHLRRDSADSKSWRGYDLDFSGAVFDGGDFSGAHFEGVTSFHGALFVRSEVSFVGATFSHGTTSFIEAEFSGSRVRFEDSSFVSGGVYFGRATLSKGRVSFSGAKFNGAAVGFSGFLLSGGTLSFGSAKFTAGPITLSGVRLEAGELTFWESKFMGAMVSLSGARFAGANVSFVGAEVSDGVINFSMAGLTNGVIRFGHTAFLGGEVKFSEMRFNGGEMVFSDARFDSSSLSFDRAVFQGSTVTFTDTEFTGGGIVDLSRAVVRKCPPVFDSWIEPPRGLIMPPPMKDFAGTETPPVFAEQVSEAIAAADASES